CSMARPQQGKERGDCGNATKLLSLASGPATGALPACQENQSFFKACNVNVEGSRMREIRTYGLTRGCWPVRLARRAGVYSTAADPRFPFAPPRSTAPADSRDPCLPI